MKIVKKRYTKRNSRKKRRYKLRYRSKSYSKHRLKNKYKQSRKQKGGNNGLSQLGYNTTRGITSTFKNFLNTYMGNTLSPSPQATKNQYYKNK